MPPLKPSDLTFNSSLPPFLQRLHQLSSSNSSSPSNSAPNPLRPRRPKTAAEEDEDAPTYLTENGETVSREAFEGMVAGKPEGEKGGVGKVGEGEGIERKDAVEVEVEVGTKRKAAPAEIGGSRKRKVGKVVGVGSDGEGAEDGREVGKKDGEGRGEDKKVKKKVKKGRSKVVLSFGDGEGEDG
ncbi:hypothetical protein M501DRAFT_993144 [Patellaria atrata CBS 101060]|uniref:DUF4604 domain-containing protein n=1 Tax=Patellaria atrata CBS 101060 TaxID=1346257 RepID=A0A9P4S916_9PEZI|nr:hypothetical protein M501DRAFT_993144 [Patellaria atrata CBS 101060]